MQLNVKKLKHIYFQWENSKGIKPIDSNYTLLAPIRNGKWSVLWYDEMHIDEAFGFFLKYMDKIDSTNLRKFYDEKTNITA